MNRQTTVRWLVVGACGTPAAWACGSHPQASFGPVLDAAADTPAAPTSTGAADGSFVGEAGSGEGGCPLGCSADLHDVVDCANVLVTACPTDQGCANGACVDACDAAAANKSSVGCDYFAVDPEEFQEQTQSCFAAYIANTWSEAVTLGVEYQGQSLDTTGFAQVPSGVGSAITYEPLPNGQLAPGGVAILFLAQQPQTDPLASVPCPAGITPAVTSSVALSGTGFANAFHVTTSRPVVAYDIYPYGGGSAQITSATLLIPTSAWDVNYVTQSGFPASVASSSDGAEPFTQVVAMRDQTHVTIRPAVDIVGGPGVPSAPAGAPQTYSLDQGQVLQLAQSTELTGSVLQSDQPVGVWGGHNCFNVDVDIRACDSAHQQIPPVRATGSQYVAVRYRNRVDNVEESVPWRIVGLVDGTTLTFDPPQTGAPTAVDSGQIARFDAPGPFAVQSQDGQHPFYIGAYMTGGDSPSMNGTGDPEWVNIVPPLQYLATYDFFTDPTYPETNLVVTRKKTAQGFADVTLDCVGTLTGWQPVGSLGAFEYTTVDLMRHDFQPQGNCSNGRHQMSSSTPFGLTIWGWGSPETSIDTLYVSYAYPGGASFQPINSVIVPTVTM